MKFGVVVFPGSSVEDMIHVLSVIMGQEVVGIWHKATSLPNFNDDDCIILPGGSSYGDHLRPGALARTSPVMQAVVEFARGGGYVWGVGNGFQILCEAQLLPGILLRNAGLNFICKNVFLKVTTHNSAITANADQPVPLNLPIAHSYGRYYADEETLNELAANDQILLQYCTPEGKVTPEANPNGSRQNIAGICNRQRNVFGIMPRPERAAEEILGNTDGRLLFESLLTAARLNGSV